MPKGLIILMNDKTITLYHGNKDKDMIPKYGDGRTNNDYGLGLYTTKEKELGMEWAMSSYTKGNMGWLHKYEIDLENMNILDLTELDTLHWIAELVSHRTINKDLTNEVINDNIEKLIKKYKLNTSIYDIIIGYRADDSYFSYTTAFVSGTMYRETLEKAIKLGDLGIQVVVKSELAFKKLKKISVEQVDSEYRQKFMTRDAKARLEYNQIILKDRTEKNKQLIYNFI